MDITKTSLGHMPSGSQWIFDDSVVDVFPDMLQRSIPQYNVMRRAVYDIGVRFVQPQTHVVDLGCSRGDSLAPFLERFGEHNKYLGIDNSGPMLDVAKKRFERAVRKGVVQLSNRDLSAVYPDVAASLTLSVLTLQFVAPGSRQKILDAVYNSTVPGGALVFVEKLAGASPEIDATMIELYHELKRTNGYSREEIESKRLALKDVLIPFTAERNQAMLHEAGFTEVDCFWRWMNFAGFVAVKR